MGLWTLGRLEGLQRVGPFTKKVLDIGRLSAEKCRRTQLDNPGALESIVVNNNKPKGLRAEWRTDEGDAGNFVELDGVEALLNTTPPSVCPNPIICGNISNTRIPSGHGSRVRYLHHFKYKISCRPATTWPCSSQSVTHINLPLPITVSSTTSISSHKAPPSHLFWPGQEDHCFGQEALALGSRQTLLLDQNQSG